jgi:hypothetical protein
VTNWFGPDKYLTGTKSTYVNAVCRMVVLYQDLPLASWRGLDTFYLDVVNCVPTVLQKRKVDHQTAGQCGRAGCKTAVGIACFVVHFLSLFPSFPFPPIALTQFFFCIFCVCVNAV